MALFLFFSVSPTNVFFFFFFFVCLFVFCCCFFFFFFVVVVVVVFHNNISLRYIQLSLGNNCHLFEKGLSTLLAICSFCG